MVENIGNGADYEVTGVAACFLDLLGQGSRLEELNERTLEGVESEGLIDAVRDVVITIEEFRKSMRSWAKAPGVPERLLREVANHDDAESIEADFQYEVRPFFFSDSGLLNVPLGGQTHIGMVLGIQKLLMASALTQIQMLAHGVLLRGGIALGAGVIRSGEDEIISAASLKAWKLEKQARSPRVLVDPDLVSDLTKMAQAETLPDRRLRPIASQARQLIEIDVSEDVAFVDSWRVLSTSEMLTPLVAIVGTSVETNLERFAGQPDSSEFQKWSWTQSQLDRVRV